MKASDSDVKQLIGAALRSAPRPPDQLDVLRHSWPPLHPQRQRSRLGVGVSVVMCTGAVLGLGLLAAGVGRGTQSPPDAQGPLSDTEVDSSTEVTVKILVPTQMTMNTALVPALDANLQARSPGTFGGVYYDGMSVIVNVVDADDLARELVSSLVSELSDDDQSQGTQPAPLVLRTGSLTFADMDRVTRQVWDGDWLPDGSERLRETHWDYTMQRLEVDVWQLTESDVQSARAVFADRVIVRNSSLEEKPSNWGLPAQ